VVGLAWTRDDQLPDVAVKLGRTASSSRRLGHGANVLEHLERRGFSHGGYAPLLLGRSRNEEGAIVATTEEALRGLWLDVVAREHSLCRLTEELTDWQIRLGLHTRSREPASLWASRFRPTVERFRAASDGLVDKQLLADVEALLRSMGPCPTVVEHHDFRPWNIYRQSTGVMGAFDWDGARIDGIPAFDLLQGHAYLGFALDGSMCSWRFRAGHEQRDTQTLGMVRRACRAWYARVIGIPEAMMQAIRPFVWMELCVDEAERHIASGAPLTRHGMDRSLFSLWEYEARQAMA
jgi:hypothetical protein